MRVRAKAKIQYHHRDCHCFMLCHFRGCSGFKIAFHKNQNDLCYRVFDFGTFWTGAPLQTSGNASWRRSNFLQLASHSLRRHREVCSLFHLKAGPQNVQGGFDSTCKDHINAESWGQGYKCPKKLLNCMENQVKTQTRNVNLAKITAARKGQQSHHVEYMWRLLLAQSVLANSKKLLVLWPWSYVRCSFGLSRFSQHLQS